MARLVIAAPTSGAGKTTTASAIIAALRRRGLRVQPFKAGPDYIDPSYQTRAAGVPARNLDSWLLPLPVLRSLFARAAAMADVAIVEGVMGLYDGRADSEDGSTAQLAKLLEAPVVLVLDVVKVSRTAAAIALGCRQLDPDVNVAGVILNRVASPQHRAWTAGPIESLAGLPVYGHVPNRPDLELPERHLGLIPMAEQQIDDAFFERIADQAESSLDLDRLLSLARSAPPLPIDAADLFPRSPVPVRARIAVALDRAFNFYYQDNLDLLEAWGAELVPFSPLEDAGLPDQTDGVYIGGGFPELFGRQFAENRAMLDALRSAAAAGIPIYAECGGLMLLSEGIVEPTGERYPLAGIVPGWSSMEQARLSVGYRTAIARCSSFLLDAGERLRGHEFHWSQISVVAPATAAYTFEQPPGRLEGYARDNVLASYLHLHFGSHPALARRFVNACAREWVV